MIIRPYQYEGLDKLWEYFQQGSIGNPLLCWPTGTGKSLAPALFIQAVLQRWPTQRFMLLSHVSELIKQNAEALKYIWPEAPLGIHSAGLKQRETAHSIIYAGIQSAVKKGAKIFGHRDILFIDEAHLLSDNDSSMYVSFIAQMKLINPQLKIIGMTATPFRMGMGLITEGTLFTDIVHDLTSMDNFNKLIDEGYLAKLIPLRTKTELDVSKVIIQKNEFVASSLQKAVNQEKITFSSLREAVEVGKDRKSWLIFSSGIEHAEAIAAQLGSFGIDCAPVHSKRPAEYNEAAIKAFKSGELRAIVNYGKLTTGFNHPEIDMIIMLRPTLSIPLWVQMLGRGTRPAEGKCDCLVLDFAKNTLRLGCINDPKIPNKKGNLNGEVPIKICENCGVYNHISAKICISCGEEFSFKVKILPKSGREELIRTSTPQIEPFKVDRVVYHRHVKIDKKTKVQLSAPMIKASYHCGLRVFNEYVGFQHRGLVLHKAHEWWRARSKHAIPTTTDDALLRIAELRVPKMIKVQVNKDFPEIQSVEW